MGKRKGILEITENFLESGLIWIEKKLDNISFKKKRVEKERKKILKKKVKYLYEDLSKSEQKGIVSQYNKKGTTPPPSAEKKKQFVIQLQFKQRIKELELIKQNKLIKELNK